VPSFILKYDVRLGFESVKKILILFIMLSGLKRVNTTRKLAAMNTTKPVGSLVQLTISYCFVKDYTFAEVKQYACLSICVPGAWCHQVWQTDVIVENALWRN
jgi:hypothetical protein